MNSGMADIAYNYFICGNSTNGVNVIEARGYTNQGALKNGELIS